VLSYDLFLEQNLCVEFLQRKRLQALNFRYHWRL